MEKNLKAFSLIELSIVILIIGILVAGVTQSSRLISQMRLTSLRNITRSSVVPTIQNLTLWLETTMLESFEVEPINGIKSLNGLISIQPILKKIFLAKPILHFSQFIRAMALAMFLL